MRLKVFEIDVAQRTLVGRAENDGRRDTGLERLSPAICTETPAIARLKTWKAEFRPRRDEIVTAGSRVGQKFRRHFCANNMPSDILRSRRAAAIPVETRHWIERARCQGFSKDAQFNFISHCYFPSTSWNRPLSGDIEILPQQGMPDKALPICAVANVCLFSEHS